MNEQWKRNESGPAGVCVTRCGSILIRLIVLALFALAPSAADAQESNIDPRYAGPPARDADGTISRSTRERARFIRMYPCPATGQVTGACPGWAVDHVIPLACGGVDAPVNMAWMPLQIKSCAKPYCKDRFERKIYCNPPQKVVIE